MESKNRRLLTILLSSSCGNSPSNYLPSHLESVVILNPHSANACHLCRCLAHIINLTTQAVISTHSKAQFCAGNPGDDHLPEDVGGTECDEIGIICAICIKVRSTPLLSLGP